MPGVAAGTYPRHVNVLDLLTALLLGALVVVVGILAFRVSNPPPPPPAAGDEAGGEVSDDVVRLLAAVRAASVMLDADDRVVRATPAAYALGVARSGALAQPELLTLVEEVRREGGSREVQLTVNRGPGAATSRLVLRVQVVALTAGRILVLAEDRTAALRLDQVRRDFVANVSHELKTPVGAIALLAETLAEAADDPDAVTHFADRLGIEARRLSGLVQDIIDLSRLQDSASVRDPEPVVIADVVAEAVARCEVEAGARDIAVTAQVIGSPEVFGDHALLVTAVRNLVDNALRYSDGGTRVTVVARVSTESDGRPGDLVEISVIDQGIGMDPTVLPRVFERFYRVDPARSRETGGTGLGLSIVKHIMADHGGEVTVWSQLGRGSTFTLRLPIAEVTPATESVTTAAPTTSQPATQPGGTT